MLRKIKENLGKMYLVTALAITTGGVSVSADTASETIKGKGLFGGDAGKGGEGIQGIIFTLADILVGIVTAASVLMLIYGAFVWVTGMGGGDDAESKGKGYVKNALIGLIIALLAYTIVGLLDNMFTSGGIFGSN